MKRSKTIMPELIDLFACFYFLFNL